MPSDSVDESEWSVDGPEGNPKVIPDPADILIGYSTIQGAASHRNSNSGSLYIAVLVRMIKRLAKK